MKLEQYVRCILSFGNCTRVLKNSNMLGCMYCVISDARGNAEQWIAFSLSI